MTDDGNQVTSPSEEIIMESHPFKILQGHIQHMTVDLDAKRVELEKNVTELNTLRENQLTFRGEVFVSLTLTLTGSITGI